MLKFIFIVYTVITYPFDWLRTQVRYNFKGAVTPIPRMFTSKYSPYYVKDEDNFWNTLDTLYEKSMSIEEWLTNVYAISFFIICLGLILVLK